MSLKIGEIPQEYKSKTLKDVIGIVSSYNEVDALSLTMEDFIEAVGNEHIYNHIFQECRTSFLHTRWENIDFLAESFCEEFGLHKPIKMEEKQEGDRDYEITVGIFSTWGYVDFYYIKTPSGGIYVTEITISED